MIRDLMKAGARFQKAGWVFSLLPGLASLATAGWVIFGRLNYLLVDHAGKIASAEVFRRGGFHHFNDRLFEGMVANLFYPPLEDAWIAAWSFLTSGDFVAAYRIHLFLVFSFFLISLHFFSRGLRSVRAGWMFLLSTGFLLWMDKPGYLDYQGLSLSDLLVIGLSGQFLGAGFFFLLLREISGRFRPVRSGILLALVLLSHIVMGIAGLILVVVHFHSKPLKSLLQCLCVGFGLSGFFWIPFLASREWATTATIFRPEPFLWASISLLFTLASFRMARRAFPVFLASFLLFFPCVIGPWLLSEGIPVPAFHYYRFAMPALLLLFSGSALWMDETPSRIPRHLPWLMVALLPLLFSPLRIDPKSSLWKPSRMDFTSLPPSSPEYGRDWILEHERSFGFGIDSMLMLKDPGFRSVKGLFWESGRSNPLISSYLATLVNSPVVLDYYYFHGYSCEFQKCLVDRFIEDYSIKRILIPESGMPRSARPEQQECFREILNSGKTPESDFVPKGSMQINEDRYLALEVRSRSGTNAAVEIVDPARIVESRSYQGASHQNVIQNRHASCLTYGVRPGVFVEEAAYPMVGRIRSEHPGSGTPGGMSGSLGEVSPGRFDLELPSPTPVWAWIKLSYFPGVSLRDESGAAAPLIPAYPGMLAYGKGRLTLEYADPPFHLAGIITSLATLAALGVGSGRKRRGHGPDPQVNSGTS